MPKIAFIGAGSFGFTRGLVRDILTFPALASKRGLNPMHVGPLPAQLALLNNISARCEELAVEGSLAGDPQMIFHACAFDPLTSAVLSLAEIRSMVRDMFEANKNWLGYFKPFH